MPTFRTRKIQVEIHFHKHYSSGLVEYSFEPRFGSLPMFNPLANQDRFKEGKYIFSSVISEERLIPFFEKLLREGIDGELELIDTENKIKFIAETMTSKMVLEPESYLRNSLDLHIDFDSNFFGDDDYAACSYVRITMKTSFYFLRKFVKELKAEYEIFKATKFDY